MQDAPSKAMNASALARPSVDGYIDDRALDGRTDDRFHLGALADELADLVASQRTPLNVAVFGPWGSGKSSLARLLGGALDERYKSIKFVPIDAWKYPEDPFRRQFIMESVRLLGLKEEKYRKKLYDTTTHSELKMPWQALRLLALVLLSLLGVCLITLLAAAALVGLVAAAVTTWNHFLGGFTGFLKSVAPAAVVVASVLTALFAVAGKLFVSDVSQSRVASAEHFEGVFREVVRDATGRSGEDRIVFFIDELDRCAARDVVAVLEGIRTFLDVDKCVFIVAADNRVLELAVQAEMPHPVPDEQANPYYSSGAEYLDKLFQHQVSIPALLPQRLTAFALSLVEDRAGVWREVNEHGSLPNLVSVLVPSHIRSPRRVKVLLNGFVSLYRVAKARHDEEPEHSPNPLQRLLELAKLSTLRLEFPLFCRDLVRYPRLAEHLTAYVRNNKSWPEGLESKARALGDAELVRAYASCGRPVELMLSAHVPPSGDAQDGQSDEGDDETVIDSSDAARRSELLSYLMKTADVPGPSRDIIFLEGAGSPYGVPGELADLVEEAATDNDLPALATLVGGLPEEERVRVVRLLHEVRRHTFGLEATNILGATLHLVGNSQLVDPASVADELVSDLTLEADARPLPVAWLSAATKLGLVALSDAGTKLAQSCASDPRLLEPDREDEAVDVVHAVEDVGLPLDDAIGGLVVGRSPGFVTSVIDSGVMSAASVSRLAADTDVLRLLSERWKLGTSDVDAEDVNTMSKTQRTHSRDVDWSLASAVADSEQTSLADAWLSVPPAPPVTPSETAVLLRVLRTASRMGWESSGGLLEGAPPTDSVILYTLTRLLFLDIDAHPADGCQAAWQRALGLVWGHSKWPRNWDSTDPGAWAVTPAWGSGDARERKMQVLRLIAGLDSNSSVWRRAIAVGYLDLVNESGVPLDVVSRAGSSLPDDWVLLDRDSRQELVGAIQAGPGAPEDHRRLWMVRISLVDNEVSLPFGADDVPSLMDGSAANNEAVALWLESRASAAEVIGFIRRVEQSDAFCDAIVGASDRFSRVEAADLAVALVDVGLIPDMPTYQPVLAQVDETLFADWLSERLREASNQAERERFMRVWSAWSPVPIEARRHLIDAYLHIASAGKGGFELALRHIELVRNPPRGFKNRLRETLTARAANYGLQKRTVDALLKTGLVKKARKGLFGRERLIGTDDE
jgi:hypothetical protein